MWDLDPIRFFHERPKNIALSVIWAFHGTPESRAERRGSLTTLLRLRTAGIGLALAQMAADAGATVYLGGSSSDKLDRALRQFDGKVRGEPVDARDEASICRFFVQAGAIDHIVSLSNRPNAHRGRRSLTNMKSKLIKSENKTMRQITFRKAKPAVPD
jgi:hypothetical protein